MIGTFKARGMVLSCLLVGVATVNWNADAANGDLAGPSIVVMQENDLVVRTDRHYTQGLKFNFLASEHGVDESHWALSFANWLPNGGMKLEAARYGVSIGQNIYTPTDISIPTLQVNDRPYAGFLYSEFMLQRRGLLGNTPVLDEWRLDLGIMGPPSLGEDAQNTVHQLRHFGLAQGWANQLTTEPGVALKYARLWRLRLGELNQWEAQFIPQTGFSLGNVGTYGMVGGELRGGYRMPRDFGVQTVDSIVPTSGGRRSKDDPLWGFYFFAGVEGRAVAYNAFLDGNLFHASHHVAKHPMVGDGKFGFVLAFRCCDVSYTQVIRSKEFIGQKETDAFGSLAIKFMW